MPPPLSDPPGPGDQNGSNSFWSAGQGEHKPPHRYKATTYQRLTNPRRSIRLLNLFGSRTKNLEIYCELVVTDFEEKTGLTAEKYEAVSWCWGRAKPTAYINIRKGEKFYAKYVPEDLIHALQALRYPQKNRYLWIDAICINQEYLLEKNHQVEMMSDIYGKADKVCVWLGVGDDSSKAALKFIKNEVLQLQNFDDLCKSEKASAKWGALLDLMQRPWFSRRWVVQEIALARKAMIYCGDDRISWNKFAVAVELFVEVETATHRLSEVMKKDPRYYHVPGWFEYVSALGASLLVDATGKLFRDYKTIAMTAEDSDSDGESDKEDSDYSDSDSYSDDDSGSGTGSENTAQAEASSSAERAKVDNQEGMQIGGDVENSSPKTAEDVSDVVHGHRGQPLLTLEYLVSSLSIFEASMDHDIIYALLAIAKDTTPMASEETGRLALDHTQHVLEIFTEKKRYKVEYEKPFVDVCRDFVQFCIERSLETDKTRALDVICRPWAPEGDNGTERPSLSGTKKSKHKKKSKGKMKATNTEEVTGDQKPGSNQKPGTASEQKGAEKPLNLPSWISRLSGASYAMYSHPGMHSSKMGRKNADSLVGLPTLTQRNYNAAERKGVDMKTLRFRKRPNVGQGHYSLYLKGFQLDTITDVYHSSQGGSIPSEWAKAGGWHKAPKGPPPDEFWRTLVADRGRDGRNPPVYYARACQESFLKGGLMSGSVNTTDLINNERCSVVAQFCRRVQAVIWNRSLIKTKSMKLGLVDKKVEKGDLICILYGCSVPVVLRRNKEKRSKDEIDAEIVEDIRQWWKEFCRKLEDYKKRVRVFKAKRQEVKQEYIDWDTKKRAEWRKDTNWRSTWAARQLDKDWWKAWEKKWAEDHPSTEKKKDEPENSGGTSEKGKDEKKKNPLELKNDDEWWKAWEEKKAEERKFLGKLEHSGDLEMYEKLQALDDEKAPWRASDKEWWKQWVLKKSKQRTGLTGGPSLSNNHERSNVICDMMLQFIPWRVDIIKKKIPLDREFNYWKSEKREQYKEKNTLDTEWKEPSTNWAEFELARKYGVRWKRTLPKYKPKPKEVVGTKTTGSAPAKTNGELSQKVAVTPVPSAVINPANQVGFDQDKKDGSKLGDDVKGDAQVGAKAVISDTNEELQAAKTGQPDPTNPSHVGANPGEGGSKTNGRSRPRSSTPSTRRSAKSSAEEQVSRQTTDKETDPPVQTGIGLMESAIPGLDLEEEERREKEKAEAENKEEEEQNRKNKEELLEYVRKERKDYYSPWHYEFLGECYIHGMMDGEAMAAQNRDAIPTTLFELR
jgi:Heterokaryon incompatibility protein (HET)